MKPFITLCALGLGLSSCARLPQASTQTGSYQLYTPEVHQTYYVVGGAFDGWDPATFRPDLHAEVERQMRLRGFEPLPPEDYFQPDILVYCTVQDKPFDLTGSHTPDPGHRNATAEHWKYQHHLHDGSLLIEMVDTHQSKLFWVGFATNLTAETDVPEYRLFPQAAQEILKDFRLVSSALPSNPKRPGAEVVTNE